MSGEIKVYFERLRDDIKLPEYKNEGDAGMDVYLPDEVSIRGGEIVLIPLGFKVAIPEGYELQMRPRSGMSLKSTLRVANSPGTIDAAYRDEVGVIMHNVDCSGRSHLNSVVLSKGERIAQLVLKQVETCKWEVVDSVEEIGFNRGGGFGSTG